MSGTEMVPLANGRTERGSLRRVGVLVAMCAVIVLVMAAAAIAFFTASGSGSGAVAVGSLSPATIAAPATSGSPVTITWAAQASASTASVDDKITYTVLRKPSGGAFVKVAGGPCAGTLAEGTTWRRSARSRPLRTSSRSTFW
jgi:hypothetical protein